MTALVLPLALLLGTLVAILGYAWQSRRLTRQLNAGTARTMRCWLRGWATPYPPAPHPGRLITVDGEPVRFECRTGRVRRLLLPAGGLRVVQVREATARDGVVPLLPAQPSQFVVLVCRDSAGTRVDVAVPTPLRTSAESFLRGTATATGPDQATATRLVGPVRQFVGRWTAAMLLVSGVLAAFAGALWWDVGRFVPASLLLPGFVAFLAFPQLLRRAGLYWRDRVALRQRRGATTATTADSSGWRSSPRLAAGELDLDTVAEALAIRARLEGWHDQAGTWQLRPTVRTGTRQPWWRIRFLRRMVLAPTVLGSISFLVLLVGLTAGIPLWQTAAAQSGPYGQATATVDRTSGGLPYLLVTQPVVFAGPDGPVRATVAVDETITVGNTVPVRYPVGDPGRATMADDRDRLGRGVTVTATLGGLGAAVWLAGWVLAVRRARRLAAALSEPDPVRMRYALAVGPRGDLTALLYPGYGRSDEPVLCQRIATAPPRTVPLSGIAELPDAGRYGRPLVVDDVVLWPAGPARPATPADTLELVNGRR